MAVGPVGCDTQPPKPSTPTTANDATTRRMLSSSHLRAARRAPCSIYVYTLQGGRASLRHPAATPNRYGHSALCAARITTRAESPSDHLPVGGAKRHLRCAAYTRLASIHTKGATKWGASEDLS